MALPHTMSWIKYIGSLGDLVKADSGLHHMGHADVGKMWWYSDWNSRKHLSY